MSFAFCDGPDSGVRRSADAPGAATSSATRARSASSETRRKAAHLYLLAGECGRALLDERAHALGEVLRSRQRVLQLGLEVQLAGHVRVEHLVERLLDRKS